MKSQESNLWKVLWDYDPNGLIAVDLDFKIKVVNPALCAMFKTTAEAVVGEHASTLLDDWQEFSEVWEKNKVIRAKEKEYSRYGLYVRKVVFPIRNENVIAAIFVDVTHEWQQKNEMQKIKAEAIEKVTQVVDNQMKVAQEIAGALGEATAETKVSLLKLVEMLKQEHIQ